MPKPPVYKQTLGYITALVVIPVATAALKAFGPHVNPATVALTLLLIVLFVAAAWGSKPAVLASLLGVACFNFFFLPPYGTFTIAGRENWIAFIAFMITALTAGQLSARARQRAAEAEDARREVERLYYELQDTFERSSQAKALKQSEQLKSALLDAVTHDLRTPLTSIKASASALLDDQRSLKSGALEARLDEEGRQEMLEIIDEEADRLDRFIGDLVELARIEAGDMQLRREWGSLSEIITTAMKRAAPLLKDHRLELWLDEELPAVRVDERALAEVIYVLVDNAAKYSPVGTTIRVAAESHENSMVRLIVEDQGPGIPVELRERVFDKFFRALRDADKPGNILGTGMGLAIAKGIVEAHGGHIGIESTNVSNGTRVVILLPTGDS